MSSDVRVGLSGSMAVIAALFVLAGCGDSSPTDPTPLPGATAAPGSSSAAASGAATSRATSGTMGASDTEEFNCVDVEATRVRFGSPGYVDEDRVGLYVYFGGIPEGAKRLRVWWDVENDPVTFHDFVFDPTQKEIEEVYEHQYSGLTGPVEVLVRVELIRDELTGNCARNRRVVVRPPLGGGGTSTSAPAAKKQTATVGPPASSINLQGFGPEGVQFTVSTTLTLDSVTIQPGSNGTVRIDLVDAATGLTTFASKMASVTGGVAQPIALGFNIAPGDYILLLDTSGLSTGSAGFTFGGAVYPYGIPGVISLTDTAYNWALSGSIISFTTGR